MNKVAKSGVLIVGILLTVIGYQNCAPAPSGSEAVSSSLQYLNMSPSDAQTAINTVDSMCALSGVATPMGNAPASFTAGTESVPVNNVYNLAGGTTTLTQAYGNVVIVGTGTVTLDGSVTGNLIICGPSVSLARGGGGNLYISNGNVQTINSYLGNIIIKNGQPLGNISNFTGNLVWENSGTYQGRTYYSQ